MRTQREALRDDLARHADTRKAAVLRRFFKTGPGEYAEGDRFRGIPVPVLRAIAKRHGDVPLSILQKLISSPWHEERLLALLIVVMRYPSSSPAERRALYRFYVRNLRTINNWDLIDLTAPRIVGAYLQNTDKKPLYRWARSKNLWKRRVAILATFHDLRNGDFAGTLKIAEVLLHDPEDLMQKAVGWMLREVGKRDEAALAAFLRDHYRTMPRTMLRAAIERFPEPRRQAYLKGTAPSGE
jgi:3-methyladenine DNA glycosylase AlkD